MIDCEEPPNKIQKITDHFPSKRISEIRQRLASRLFTSAFIRNGVSFRFMEDEEFKEGLKTLHPGYEPPSATTMRTTILHELSIDCYKSTQARLQAGGPWATMIDGWTDVSGNSIVTLLAVNRFEKCFIDILDMTEKRHTAETLETELVRTIEKHMDESTISAFVTDNPSVNRRLRESLTTRFPNVLPVGCALHEFNSIIRSVLQHEDVVSVVRTNNSIIAFFKRAHYWAEVLQRLAKEAGISHGLSPYVDTRWVSIGKSCLSVQENEPLMQKCIQISSTLESQFKLSNANIELLNDRHHFANNQDLLQVLKPIVDSISRLEQDSSTLGDVLAEFGILHWTISRINDNSKRVLTTCKKLALEQLCRRVKNYDSQWYWLAFFLTPAYKKVAVSKRYTTKNMIRFACALVKRWEGGISRPNIDIICDEVGKYFRGAETYGRNFNGKSAYEYWSHMPESVLKRVALRLLAIPPHTADVERLFSSMGLMKTKLRNRYELFPF